MDKARMTMTGPGPATGAVRKRRVRQPLDPKVMKEFMASMVEYQMELAAAMLERQRFFDAPASSEAILALPTPRVGETAEQDCAVCRQAFKEGDQLRMMPCSHSFHLTCIYRRLRTKGNCPCCRFAMPAAAADDD